VSPRSIARAALLVSVVALAVLGWVFYGGPLNASAIEAGVRELGPFAPLTFVGAFALATVCFLPGSLFGLAGGIMFGPLWGTVWNLVGGTLGATMAFLAARFIAGDRIAAKTGGRVKTLLSGVESEGWRFVALTRLVPIVPFNVLNYVLGLTRIALSHYVLATLVCMTPGALAYAWLGYAGRAAMAGDSDAIRYAALGLAALAVVAFVPRLARRLKQQVPAFMSLDELKRSLAGAEPPLIVDVREPGEFDGPLGHIDDAINIPLAHLPAVWEDLGACAPPVVVVCRTDRRSAQAAEILRARGVENVKVLRGGMEAWTKTGAAPVALSAS
jgi:uncharacterized membrane protein YdjX (TVP38/TMEM64 family)/rhodanese-related sulfurtransferase